MVQLSCHIMPATHATVTLGSKYFAEDPSPSPFYSCFLTSPPTIVLIPPSALSLRIRPIKVQSQERRKGALRSKAPELLTRLERSQHGQKAEDVLLIMILHLLTLGQGSTLFELQVVEKSTRSMTTDAIVIFQHVLHYRGAMMHRDVDAVQRERESQTDRKE